MDQLAAEAIQVPIPPDSSKRKALGQGGTVDATPGCVTVLAPELGGWLYRKRHQTIEPVFAQIKYNRKITGSNEEAAPRCAVNGD